MEAARVSDDKLGSLLYSDFLLKKRAAIPEEFEEEYPPQHDDTGVSLKKAAAGAPDGPGPNSSKRDSLSSTALVQHERNQRTAPAGSNEATHPGAVHIAGPGANSSDLESQAMIIIGSNSNVVANTTEENNEETGIIEETILTAFRVDEETSGEILHGVPISDVVDPTTERKKNKRRACLWVSSTIVLVGLAIGLSLGLGGKTTASTPTFTPTASPLLSNHPPAPPTIDTVIQRGILRCGVIIAVDAMPGLHSFNVDLVSAAEL